MKLIFLKEHCSTAVTGQTVDEALNGFQALQMDYDPDTRVLSIAPPSETFEDIQVYTRVSEDSVTNSSNRKYIKEWSRWTSVFNGSRLSVTLTEEQAEGILGFDVSFRPYGAANSAKAQCTTYFANLDAVGTLIYPTGVIAFNELPVTVVGFKDEYTGVDFTHIQILIAEILDDGAVGGEGRVWESPFYSKHVDTVVTLENIIDFCEGRELTNFNVSFHFVSENETGGYDFVRAHIVGGATTETTFSVQSVEAPLVSLGVDGVCYCLDPVLLTVNRHENRDIQFVRVEIGNYIADFEFNKDRNLLQIDIAEYLQTLFALVDLFEFQQMQATVAVKLYDADWNHLQTQGRTITAVYGKHPDPALPQCKMRVQWLDKYGALHDEYFKIADNLTEGASKQKYINRREEREDKTGEKAVTLAYVAANAAQKEALKTVVFADHVRAFIGDSWKRVKVANTYKTGKGREKQNFEFTIKYAL